MRKAPKHCYLLSPDDVVVLDGAGEAVRALNDCGVPAIFVTNQPGFHKGLLDIDRMSAIDDVIARELRKRSARIDGVIYCPHPAPTEGDCVTPEMICGCRKPKPGMLTAMIHVYGANPERTVMIGDFVSDIGAAKAAGVNGLYVATRHDEYDDVQRQMQEKHPDVFMNAQYATLLDAVRSFTGTTR